MADSPWHNEQALKELYVNQGLTTYEIADRWDCSDVTISDWLDRHDIPARDPDPPTMVGENNPRHIGRETVIEDYQEVAKELEKTPSQEEYNNHGEYTWSAIQGYFDSMGDLQDAAGLERLKKGRVEIVCEWCGGTDDVKHAKKESTSFCSPGCANEWKSDAYSGAGNPYDYNDIEITCEECGTVVPDPHSPDQRFCQPSCMHAWRGRKYSGENHPRWNPDYDEETDNRSYRGPNWDEQREKALERDDHTCQECGTGEHLQVHHITPWDSFDDVNYKEANRVENLLALCTSCHMKIRWGSISVQTDFSHYSS